MNPKVPRYFNFTCSRYVWPWAENEAIRHDSYHGLKYTPTVSRPFPGYQLTGPNNFVGAPVMENKVANACCAKKH